MNRLHSIRTRILGGFVVLVLLQLGASALNFRAQSQAEAAAGAEAVARAGYQQLMKVALALRTAQWQLAEFLRLGDTAHREAALSALTAFSDQSKALAGDGAAAFSATAGEVEVSLKEVLAAASKRRDSSAAIIEAVVGVQNALTALARSASEAPDRDTADATAAALATSGSVLTLASRYAASAIAANGQMAVAAVPALKAALLLVPQTSTNVPARVSRLVATTIKQLDRLEPAIMAFDAANAESDVRLKAVGTVVAQADSVMDRLTQRIEAEREQRRQDALRAQSFTRMTTIAAAAGGCVLGLVLSVVVGLSITRPIGRLATAMRRVGSGDLDCDVPDQRRRDEIGSMSQALFSMRESGRRARQLEAEAVAQRERADAERREAEAARAAESSKQQHVVDKLAGALSKLAAGDLIHQLDEEFAAGYERLRADFNLTVLRLADTIGGVANTIDTIRSGNKEIASASDDLASRTEQQAANLGQTAAMLEQITSTVRQTAEGASHAHDVVGAARDHAGRSHAVVDRAIQAMDGIKTSAQQIGQIVSLIDEIAFQTNLLALNAGVEAARAGDTGRGFAVVASEVRALAQRSAGAAKEIKSLILESSRHVTSGVELVGEAGEALRRIAAQVTDIDAVVAEIAAAAKAQAGGLQEVNSTVSRMDLVTQQNAAMVEQSTAAAHALAQQTDSLARMIAHFRVEVPTTPSPYVLQTA